MKKYYCLLCSILLICLVGCHKGEKNPSNASLKQITEIDYDIRVEYSKDAAMELNANSHMGLSLLYEVDRDKHMIEYDFRFCKYLIKSGYYLSYGYIGYYPLENNSVEVITSVHMEGSELHVFGIKEGDKIYIVPDVMDEYGYVLDSVHQYNDEMEAVYRKGDVCISFYYIKDNISSIIIYFDLYSNTQQEVVVY